MLQGFKQFMLRGNVLDLAVAVVMGAAFGHRRLGVPALAGHLYVAMTSSARASVTRGTVYPSALAHDP